ncbi:MAG: FHA domain-containing protein [Polyangiaceae bacterium]
MIESATEIYWLEYRGMRHRIHEGETLVGRGSRVAFFLDEPSVSREHALVRRTGDSVMITDLGSSNGTFVNGEAATGTRRLSVGDRVRLGTAELHFGVTRGVSPSSISPGIELIEQQSVVRPAMDLSTEPAFGSIEVLETLVRSPESAESLTELSKMVQSSVERLVASADSGRVNLGAAERARVLAIARTVCGWGATPAAETWLSRIRARLDSKP